MDGHVPFRVAPREAADAGQRTFEHLLAHGDAVARTEAEPNGQRSPGVLARPGQSAVIERGPAGAFPALSASL